MNVQSAQQEIFTRPLGVNRFTVVDRACQSVPLSSTASNSRSIRLTKRRDLVGKSYRFGQAQTHAPGLLRGKHYALQVPRPR